MLKSLLPTAVNDNALSVPFMIDKEVMAEIFGCNDIYDSGTLHGWTNIMLFQHYFKVTVERKAETIGINSKRPSCHNLYCVFLLIPYFPVYKFQNRQHCLTASVCQWSKAEEKKEWLILTLIPVEFSSLLVNKAKSISSLPLKNSVSIFSYQAFGSLWFSSLKIVDGKDMWLNLKALSDRHSL